MISGSAAFINREVQNSQVYAYALDDMGMR